ncbi:MAG: LptA/OstA family protein [PVC group bacterium]
MKSAIGTTVLVFIGSLISPVFFAAPEPEAPPDDEWTVVTCDGNLFLDYGHQQATFFNNVLVKNPRGSLRADRLVIFFTPDGKKVERTEGEGNVQILSEEKTGNAEKVIYYPDEKKAVLLGDAVITSRTDSVRGGQITFYLDRNEIEVEDTPGIKFFPDRDYNVNF